MPKIFRHKNQLLQLERKDKAAACKAHRLIEINKINAAIAVIISAMHRLNELPVSPPLALSAITDPPLYDLVICVKKYGYNTTSQADNPIVWLKFAGQSKEVGRGRRVTDTEVQRRLEEFELIDTEVQQFQVIYKYSRR